MFLIYTSIDHIPDLRSVSPRDGGNSSSRILHNRASSSKSGKKKKFGKFFLSLNRDNIQEIIDRDMLLYTKKEKKRKKSLKETGEMTFHFERERRAERGSLPGCLKAQLPKDGIDHVP